MNTADILVLSGIAVSIIAAIGWIVRRKRQGKGGCGCCPYRGNCGAKC